MEQERVSFWSVNKDKIKLFVFSLSIAVFSMLSLIGLALPGLVESGTPHSLRSIVFGGMSGAVEFQSNTYLVVAVVLLIVGFASMIIRIGNIRYLVGAGLYLAAGIFFFFTRQFSDLSQVFSFGLDTVLGAGAVFTGAMLVISSVASVVLYVISFRHSRKVVSTNE